MTRGLHFQRAKPLRGALLPALLLALVPGATQAQDAAPGGVGDFQLPPGPTRPASPAQGPVDDQVPVVRPTRTAPPEPAASPSATPQPQATQAPRAAAPPRPRDRALPAPARPDVLPAPLVSEAAAPLPTRAAEPAPMPTAIAPTAAPPSPGSGLPIWPVALVAAALLLGGAFWLLRRKTATPATPYEAEAAPVPVPLAPTRPISRPDPVPLPLAAAAPHISLALEAHHLSRSLVYVTLAYRLTVSNAGSAPHGALHIAGDLASAHASQSREAQLNPAASELEHRHAIAGLAPGESVTLSGEMRLPVSAILPIRQGAAELFVPLARFSILGADGIAITRVFVIGQPADQPGGALRPFRIDAMPGVFRELALREIATPA